MSENTKEEKDFETSAQEFCPEQRKNSETESGDRELAEKSYYYDDAYGYKVYNPESDDQDEE